MSRPPWIPRHALEGDIAAIEALISRSVRALHRPFYSELQINASIGTVFGVDRQLIEDRSYFVVEHGGAPVGCGGWSRRASLCGSDTFRTGKDPLVDPRTEAARVRAFFVDPSWVRMGVGSAILARCELEIVQAGFRRVVIMATLPGEALYASFGYQAVERCEVGMPGGLTLAVVRMEKEILGGPVQAP